MDRKTPSENSKPSVADMNYEFVSFVSHELRAPLAIVKEGVTLVLDKVLGKTNQKQEQVLRTARKNIDRLDQIIMNMLEISRIEAGKETLKKETFSFAGLLKQVPVFFDERIKEKGIKLNITISDPSLEIIADKEKIKRVLMSLVANAVKFTQNGSVEIAVTEKAKEIECVVKDTGVGIAASDLPKVFGKFQQLGWEPGGGEKGAGLSLAIAKSFVELHGGRIGLESQEGKGTKIIFVLPKKK